MMYETKLWGLKKKKQRYARKKLNYQNALKKEDLKKRAKKTVS